MRKTITLFKDGKTKMKETTKDQNRLRFFISSHSGCRKRWFDFRLLRNYQNVRKIRRHDGRLWCIFFNRMSSRKVKLSGETYPEMQQNWQCRFFRFVWQRTNVLCSALNISDSHSFCLGVVQIAVCLISWAKLGLFESSPFPENVQGQNSDKHFSYAQETLHKWKLSTSFMNV